MADPADEGGPHVVRLTYVGHATVAIELAGRVLLTDPVLRGRVAFLRRTVAAPATGPLRAASAVLVSHLHHDHCDPPSLAQLGRHRPLLVPAGTEGFFRRQGWTDVRPLRPGQTCALEGVEVTATPAAHDGRRRPFGPRGAALGFVVSGSGRRVYFAGDTGLFAGMRGIAGGLDVALLPVIGWGRTLGPGHLDPAAAAEATAMLRPALAVPVHWGTLRPVWDPALEARQAAAARTFAVEVLRRGLPTEVAVVEPGGSLTWPG